MGDLFSGQVAAGLISLWFFLRRFQEIAVPFLGVEDCVTRRVVTLRCVCRSGDAAVFQRSCECLGGVPARVTVVFAPAAVPAGSGTVGVATKLAGPESVREVASSVCRSVAAAVLAEAEGGCPGCGLSAAVALTAKIAINKIAINKIVPGARPAAPVNGLFILAEI